VDVNDGAGGVRCDSDAVDSVENCTGDANIIMERREDGWCTSKDVYPLGSADREQGWHRSGIDKGRAVDAL
jgi:hypothetical protein